MSRPDRSTVGPGLAANPERAASLDDVARDGGVPFAETARQLESPSWPSRILASLPWLLLLGCLGASLRFSAIGWRQPLLDSWSFRQTQTAISTRYLIEDGFKLDYETPVLGAPWSLPYEFPTYQFCVAALVKTTGLPLESAGRLVSLLFAYGAFALLGWWVATTTRSRTAGVYASALALASPVYLFGSRAFLIESTALCFTVAMLVAWVYALRKPRWETLAGLLVVASLAGLTKATTYAVGLVGVVGTLVLEYPAVRATWRSLPRCRPLLAATIAALAVPFILTLAWTHHTDLVKARNELATFTTSAALHDWNYGTWAQRFDFRTWDRFLYWVNHFVFGMPLVWVVALFVTAWSRALPRAAFVAAAMFLAGWLAFTNLYVVHEHYYYASGVYLLAFVAIAFGVAWDTANTPGRLAVGAFAAPLCVVLMLWGYVQHTLPEQRLAKLPLLQTAAAVEKLTPAESVIVTYGYDWESSLPYYAHRRALMLRGMPAGDDPAVRRALQRLDRPLGALVFRRPGPADNTRFVLEQLTKFGVSPQRAFSDSEGDIYLAADTKMPDDAAWQRAGFVGRPALIESPLPFCELLVRGRSAMLAHAPGLLVLDRNPQRSTLRCEFGLTDDAFTREKATDGVTFVIDHQDDGGKTVRLLERRLDPSRVPSDRGLQQVELQLPEGQRGLLFLRTLPGPNNAFDWSVWRNVKIE